MDRKGSANYDPGWNDPPLFSYDSQAAQLRTSRPRTVLNKRVSFPLHSASPPSSNNISVDPTAPLPTYNISTLPPPPSANNISPAKDTEEEEEQRQIFDSLEAFKAVTNNLCQVLNIKFKEKEKNKNEIQKRLETMRTMWLDDKLCKDVQQKLLYLSEAIRNDEVERADELQKGLMVDHPTSCSPWMSGVRHLIHHQEPEDIDNH